jgi:putative transposase
LGTIDVAIPKLRSGTYFPDWLLQRRRRADGGGHLLPARGFHAADGPVGAVVGDHRLSRSQVSQMAKDLDGHVEDFRTRPLDAGPYTFVAADALMMKVREGGRVINVAVLVATGSTPTGTGRSSGSRSTPARPAPALGRWPGGGHAPVSRSPRTSRSTVDSPGGLGEGPYP